MAHTILFVDDEPEVTEGIRMVLEAKGYSCIVKKDATSALDYLAQHKVDVIVSDIMMSGGDFFNAVDSSETGFYFMDKLRKDMPHISVICYSVIGDQRKIDKLKGKGVLYLRKGETHLNKAVKLIESKVSGITRFKGN